MKLKLGYIVPTLIVLISGAVYLGIENYMASKGSAAKEASKVKVGSDYYVTLTLVELEEKKPDGSDWDSYNDSAPDIFFKIFWRDHEVHKSATKDDTLIGKWSNAEVDVREMALKGENASVDDLIQAARINIQKGELITFKIFDADLLGAKDEAGEFSIKATELALGDNPFSPGSKGVKRIVVRVIDIAQAPSYGWIKIFLIDPQAILYNTPIPILRLLMRFKAFLLLIISSLSVFPGTDIAQAEQLSVKTPLIYSSKDYLCEIGADFTKLLDANETEIPLETAQKQSLKKEKKARKRLRKLLRKVKSATGKVKKRLKKRAQNAKKIIQLERDFREELAMCINETLAPALIKTIERGTGQDNDIEVRYNITGGSILFNKDKSIRINLSIVSNLYALFPGSINAKGVKDPDRSNINNPLYDLSGTFQASTQAVAEQLKVSTTLNVSLALFSGEMTGMHSSQSVTLYLIGSIDAFNPGDYQGIDNDGDVDLKDYFDFCRCYSGPNMPASADCLAADVDVDGDVDFTDYNLIFGSGLKIKDKNSWSWE